MIYFAYGSNMLQVRLQERVGDCRLLGAARLSGYRLAWHKIGSRDGTAKCDIVRKGNGVVWGALYEIDPSRKRDLDRAEGAGNGYEEMTVSLELAGRCADACTYYATAIDPDLRPFQWYKDIVLAGACQLGLPEDYIRSINRVEAIPDPDTVRSSRHAAILNRAGRA